MILIVDNIRRIENAGHFAKVEDRKFEYFPIENIGTIFKGSELLFQIDGFRQPDDLTVKIQLLDTYELKKMRDSVFLVSSDIPVNGQCSLVVTAKWLDGKQPTLIGIYAYILKLADK